MRVGWLTDPSPYTGGAELTQAEFRASAPAGVEVVDCPPGGVVPELDVYVLHNHVTYSQDDLTPVLGRAVRYCHDVRKYGLGQAMFVCCSPLQAERMGYESHAAVVPPAIDLSAFKLARAAENGRQGACWIGHFQNHGKGIDRALEWAEANDQIIDFYGEGPLAPNSPYARVHNAVRHNEVPAILAQYKTFVHLPTVIEPFGRSAVEAWAAGLDLVINGNVGARYWIEEKPEALETAAKDFWRVVLDA